MDQANEQQGTEGTPPPTGISLGYACVSTTDQNLERLCHSVTLSLCWRDWSGRSLCLTVRGFLRLDPA